jgi:hypothetical protein
LTLVSNNRALQLQYTTLQLQHTTLQLQHTTLHLQYSISCPCLDCAAAQVLSCKPGALASARGLKTHTPLLLLLLHIWQVQLVVSVRIPT